ncbi:hypothetical protein CBR_g10882 [Chara braunii]|uniref:Uncharacterized protein n=1 Tax=Chara braunii TaxID=69332 RepID=A0A388KPH8_CHABU|nr:hypothetical protein CBR_g10882 [Chara braunii]|eukprot:GBG71945.1 hypothetical protein CBR_g10882 [Chara braunii]
MRPAFGYHEKRGNSSTSQEARELANLTASVGTCQPHSKRGNLSTSQEAREAREEREVCQRYKGRGKSSTPTGSAGSAKTGSCHHARQRVEEESTSARSGWKWEAVKIDETRKRGKLRNWRSAGVSKGSEHPRA